MFKTLLVIFFLLLSTQSYSQIRTQDVVVDWKKAKKNHVYNSNEVDERAHFPHGESAWRKYLLDKSRYPKMDKKFQVKGKVYLSMVVEKDGSITDLVIWRGLNSQCDEDALWLIKSSGKWIPGVLKKKMVRSKVHPAINYGSI